MKFKQILTVISIIGCTGLCACSDSLLDIEQMGVKSRTLILPTKMPSRP